MSDIYARNGSSVYESASSMRSSQVYAMSGDVGGGARRSANAANTQRSVSMLSQSIGGQANGIAAVNSGGEDQGTMTVMKRKKQSQAGAAPRLSTQQRVTSAGGGGGGGGQKKAVAAPAEQLPPPIPPKKPRAQSTVYGKIQDLTQLPVQDTALKTVQVPRHSITIAPNVEQLHHGIQDQKLLTQNEGATLKKKQPDFVFVCRLKRPRDQQQSDRRVSVPTPTLSLSENFTFQTSDQGENPEIVPPPPPPPPEPEPELELVSAVKTGSAMAAGIASKKPKRPIPKILKKCFVSRNCWAAGTAVRDVQLQATALDTPDGAEQPHSTYWFSPTYIRLFAQPNEKRPQESPNPRARHVHTPNCPICAPASEKSPHESYTSESSWTPGEEPPTMENVSPTADDMELPEGSILKSARTKSAAGWPAKHSDSCPFCRPLGTEAEADAPTTTERQTAAAPEELSFDSCGILVLPPDADEADHPFDDAGILSDPFKSPSKRGKSEEEPIVQETGVQAEPDAVDAESVAVQTETLRYARDVLLQVGASASLGMAPNDLKDDETWPAPYDMHSFISTGQPTLIGFNWDPRVRRTMPSGIYRNQSTQTEPMVYLLNWCDVDVPKQLDECTQADEEAVVVRPVKLFKSTSQAAPARHGIEYAGVPEYAGWRFPFAETQRPFDLCAVATQVSFDVEERGVPDKEPEPEPEPEPAPAPAPEPEPEEEEDEEERNSSSQHRMKFDIHEVLDPATAHSEKQEFLDYTAAVARNLIEVKRGIYHSADGPIPIVQAVFTGNDPFFICIYETWRDFSGTTFYRK